MLVNLQLFDIDGCIYQGFGAGGPVENWLIKTNQNLLVDYIIPEIQRSQYNKVIVAYGTNRQDRSSDVKNSPSGGSMAPALPLIQSYLANQVTSEVVLEPFLMSDIYGKDKAAGESYEAILKEEYCKESSQHSKWMFDHSKISLIYAHAHRVATLHPNDSIVIDFYDDTKQLLSDNYDFFSTSPDFLPKNVTFRLTHYAGSEAIRYKKEIRGTGITDTHYDWSVRLMASKTYFYSGVDASEDTYIDSAAKLSVYHVDDHYHGKERRMEMNGSYISRIVFRKFREQEITKLQSSEKLISANYTTALVLNERGLIPGQFIIEALSKTANDSTVLTEATTLEEVSALKVSSCSIFTKHNSSADVALNKTMDLPQDSSALNLS